MFDLDSDAKMSGVMTYIFIMLAVIFLLWYSQKYLLAEEKYAPTRERSDPQSDWSIVKAVEKINLNQKKFFSRLTQSPNYGY